MLLRHMDYVYAVYQHKSFSKAAEQLYITQPALSAAIKRVEEEIGLPIFDRSTNPVQLTPAGEYYIQAIEKIMDIEKEMRAHFRQLLEANQGTIHVGGASFFCAYILPSIVQQFKETHPGYTVHLLEANSDNLQKHLRAGQVDIIVDVEKLDPSLFDSVIWREEHILLAVPRAYQINQKLKKYRLSIEEVRSGLYLKEHCPKVDLKEFKQENFLLLKKGNDLHQRGLKMCRKAGFIPHVTMYLDQLLTAFYIACEGKGITFVRAGMAHYLDVGDKLFFYKIDDQLSKRNIMIYYRKSPPLSKIGQEFIHFLLKNKPVGI